MICFYLSIINHLWSMPKKYQDSFVSLVGPQLAGWSMIPWEFCCCKAISIAKLARESKVGFCSQADPSKAGRFFSERRINKRNINLEEPDLAYEDLFILSLSVTFPGRQINFSVMNGTSVFSVIYTNTGAEYIYTNTGAEYIYIHTFRYKCIEMTFWDLETIRHLQIPILDISLDSFVNILLLFSMFWLNRI